MRSDWAAAEGLPFPLGATWIEEERAFNFALYSKHAESVALLLYAPDDIVNPVLVYSFDYLRNKSGRVWHCRIPLEAMKGAAYHAYRVGGPPPAERFEWPCRQPDLRGRLIRSQVRREPTRRTRDSHRTKAKSARRADEVSYLCSVIVCGVLCLALFRVMPVRRAGGRLP